MVLPKIWGAGQLFAYSAWDGPSYGTSDFAGMLSADRIGIRFYSKVRRELAIVNVQGEDLRFDAVTSDYIHFQPETQMSMCILYARRHLIIGKAWDDACPIVITEGIHHAEMVDNIQIQDTLDGEFTALAWDKSRFAFAFGYTKEQAMALAAEGMNLQLEEEEAKKGPIMKHTAWKKPSPTPASMRNACPL